jgi:hypothetical protein
MLAITAIRPNILKPGGHYQVLQNIGFTTSEDIASAGPYPVFEHGEAILTTGKPKSCINLIAVTQAFIFCHGWS